MSLKVMQLSYFLKMTELIHLWLNNNKIKLGGKLLEEYLAWFLLSYFCDDSNLY